MVNFRLGLLHNVRANNVCLADRFLKGEQQTSPVELTALMKNLTRQMTCLHATLKSIVAWRLAGQG
jgi:hypothetical protein